MVEKIEQHHREQAAAGLEARYPTDPKTAKIAAMLRAGEMDDNAAVQAAAFYEVKDKTYTFKVTGRPMFTVDAASPVLAMTAANKNFTCLPQGAWMENGLNNFFWALGNFFD